MLRPFAYVSNFENRLKFLMGCVILEFYFLRDVCSRGHGLRNLTHHLLT